MIGSQKLYAVKMVRLRDPQLIENLVVTFEKNEFLIEFLETANTIIFIDKSVLDCRQNCCYTALT